ncbi:MAG TPA: DnaB-like helicase C-terminal domain-containing protein [Salinarimonas sp.]|nr:DnaB-like helicase C-terminal domain-containing protein [Salinarimonas sp.]
MRDIGIAERALLGCFILSPAEIDLYPLQRDDFAEPRYQALYDTMAALRKAGQPVDAVTITLEIERRGHRFLLEAESLAEIANSVPHAVHVAHYAREVMDASAKRRLRAVLREMDARLDTESSIEVATDARRRLAEIEARADGPMCLGDGIDEVTRESLDGVPPRTQVLTGLAEFDAMTGGFHPPQLIVVAARPGIGKSALAGTIALRVAKRGVPVLFFSMEMNFKQVARRMLGAEAQYPVRQLVGHRVSLDDQERLQRASTSLRSLPIYIHAKTLSSKQVSATTRSWRLKHGAGERALVVIDYLGLMLSTEKKENRTREIGEWARDAKTLAVDINAPVMLISQLNRGLENRDNNEPRLSDLRDSGEIEQHADMVVFPTREEPLGESGPAHLIVAKNRDGEVGKVPCWWKAEWMCFESLGEEQARQYERREAWA